MQFFYPDSFLRDGLTRTSRGGKVLMEPRPTDGQTEGIFRFNEAAASDTRVRTVMIPVRDGLTIMQKITPLLSRNRY